MRSISQRRIRLPPRIGSSLSRQSRCSVCTSLATPDKKARTHWIGSDAILVLKYLIALLIGFLCLRCAESMGANVNVWGLLCPIAIYLSQLGFLSVIRAQVYSFLFTACCFWIFEQDRRGDRRWLIPWL